MTNQTQETGLTNNLEEACDAGHGIGVDLAHVPAPVADLRLADVECPGAVPTVRHCDPVVLRDYVAGDRQDRLRVDAQPGHLQQSNFTVRHQLRPLQSRF